jgi:hypothetical protein
VFCSANKMKDIEGYVCVASRGEGKEKEEIIFGKNEKGKIVDIETEGFAVYSGLEEACKALPIIRRGLGLDSLRIGYLEVVNGNRSVDFGRR